MLTIADALKLLQSVAPLELAEEWDNVGLLTGDPAAPLAGLMTCLTLTPNVADEAIQRGASLVVTHHPLPFRPLSKITTQSLTGDTVWRLARAGVAIYSAHTAYDSASGGINQQWAEGLGLSDIRPLLPEDPVHEDGAGVGRIGTMPSSDFDAMVASVKKLAGIEQVQVVRPDSRLLRQTAVACGSGSSLLESALEAGVDLFITGEIGFHDCLQAQSAGVGLILTGHYASERFAMESLAKTLQPNLSQVKIWASKSETDPLIAA